MSRVAINTPLSALEPKPVEATAIRCRIGSLPPMAPQAFHGLAGEIIADIEPHSESSREAILGQFLVAVGNAVGRRPYFPIEADRHHVNEFLLLVGDTARSRKGTSWGYARRIVSDADPEWARRIASGLHSAEGLIHHVRDDVMRWDAKKKERVLEDPGESDKRLLAVETEFASVIKRCAREGNTLSPILRQAWDSGNLRTLIKNHPETATGAHISTIGHITAAELQGIDQVEICNGFLNRFLILVVTRRQYLPLGGNVSKNMLTLASETLRSTLEAARSIEQMTFDREGEALWRTVYEDLATGNKFGLLDAVLSRAEAHVLRLSCLYALVDGSAEIRREHLEAALAFWSYCEASCRFLFGDALGDRYADRLWDALKGQPGSRMTFTEIRDLFQRNVHVEAVVDRLVRVGIATTWVENNGDRGRPINWLQLYEEKSA